ncbi:MAG: hypothetical protein ACRDL6_10625 [Solirubrobacterales bacterium]
MSRFGCVTALVLSAAALGAGCGGEGASESNGSGAADGKAGAPEFGRNVVRVPGRSSTDVAAAATLAAYPPGQGKAPNGFVLFPREDWRRAVLAGQFVSAPANAALVPTEPDYLPTAAADLVSRLRPPGFPGEATLHALLLGEPGEEVVLAFQERRQSLTKLGEPDPNKLSGELVAYRGGWAKGFSDDILIVSAEDEDRPYALIAAAWSGLTGDTVAFVEGDTIPQPTAELLEQRRKLRLIKPTIWLLGPESVVSETVAEELGGFGEVKRVEGEGPIETAVEMARYRDQETGFGWGLKRAPVNVSLVNLNDWGNAVGALQLTGAGPRAALLLTDDSEQLPEAVAEYLREIQGPEPSQGYVLGDPDSISSSQLAELDELLEASGPGADAKPGTSVGPKGEADESSAKAAE